MCPDEDIIIFINTRADHSEQTKNHCANTFLLLHTLEKEYNFGSSINKYCRQIRKLDSLSLFFFPRANVKEATVDSVPSPTYTTTEHQPITNQSPTIYSYNLVIY